LWLKYYVYLRLLPNDKKSRGPNFTAAMSTFIVAAVWHGFYSGYFNFFIGAGLLDF
jgi:D-alanyl-lipoteichoic acid acyltransferase DltB (MBOAT superfamily)